MSEVARDPWVVEQLQSTVDSGLGETMQELIDMIVSKYATSPVPYVRQVRHWWLEEKSLSCCILFSQEHLGSELTTGLCPERDFWNRLSLSGFLYLVVVACEVFWRSQSSTGWAIFCTTIFNRIMVIYVNKRRKLILHVRLIPRVVPSMYYWAVDIIRLGTQFFARLSYVRFVHIFLKD